MKRNGKKITLFLVSIFLFLGIHVSLSAQSCDSTCNPGDTSCLSKVITDCGSKVATLQNQANTLKNQIAQFDAQVRLTTLKIQETEEKIMLLGGRIDQLEESLLSLTKAFSSRAVATYKLSKFENNFAFILTASDVNDAVSRFHYLRKIQEEDKNLLERTVYIILIVNIFISLIASSLILSFKGSENNLVFSFENDPEFAIAVFLSFIIFYPFMFFILYIMTFFILIITIFAVITFFFNNFFNTLT